MASFVTVGASLLALPSGSGSFSVPNPPTPGAAAKPLLKPDFSTQRFTGKDRFRQWIDVVLDGLLFFCNGYDQPWYWDAGSNAYDMGSTVPTSFAAVDDATGSAFPANTLLTYYLVFRNSTLGKETAPQIIEDVTNVATFEVDITWTDPGGEFDVARIYRRLQGESTVRLVAEVAAATAAYTDTTLDASLSVTVYVDRFRETKPPVFVGMEEYDNILLGFTGADSTLYYSQRARTDDEFVLDDFPASNLLFIGENDGFGPITALVKNYASLLVFKKRACYEITGAFGNTPGDLGSIQATLLFADRGSLSQRTFVALDSVLVFLDERGLHIWTPGQEPLMAGTGADLKDSPLSPIWQRLNRDALHYASLVHHEEEQQVEVWVALDYDPVPLYRIIYSYARNIFVSVDHNINGMAMGYLDDAAGIQHLMRIDDLGHLWEEQAGNAEGVYAGDLTAAITAGTATLITCGSAAFDTTEVSGGAGAPLDRYNSSGDVIDENRIAAITGTTITPLYFSTTVPAAAQSVGIGVIPSKFQLPKTTLNVDGEKQVPRLYIEYEVESGGTLRIDSAPDQASFTNRREFDLTAGNGRALIITDDRGWRWHMRGIQRNAGEGFSISRVHIEAKNTKKRR